MHLLGPPPNDDLTLQVRWLIFHQR
jgi:hypothetical protein